MSPAAGDVATRYYGRQATEEEIAAAMRVIPAMTWELPRGLLVVARGGRVLGCAGLRQLPGRIGEVTRVFVIPAASARAGLAAP